MVFDDFFVMNSIEIYPFWSLTIPRRSPKGLDCTSCQSAVLGSNLQMMADPQQRCRNGAVHHSICSMLLLYFITHSMDKVIIVLSLVFWFSIFFSSNIVSLGVDLWGMHIAIYCVQFVFAVPQMAQQTISKVETTLEISVVRISLLRRLA